MAGEEESQEKDRCPDYAFHVQHASGAKLMFDMGFNKVRLLPQTRIQADKARISMTTRKLSRRMSQSSSRK